ncbi:YceI family protein [Altererythrobacter lutimaris]|uniref:YceI family protein n=1 Tax=Altererythrobacter lutimaris TaxID=2743979 RepID=A0A850H861_9SPHN|nr:YceI family protein [Altererythrobacter lutimaris]NVE93425.1 YceI family protein [Altererythrobacter lutimaris]
MTPLRALLLALFAALLVGASPAGQVYAVDNNASALNAKVGFLGIGRRTAGFPEVSGTVRLDKARPETIDLDVTIDARALTAPDDLTLSRLKGEKFFWVEKYPQVRFVGREMKLTSPKSGTVDGELTARGVTQPVTLEVIFDTAPADLVPGEAVTLSGTTRINRRAFGMTSYSLIVGKWVNIELRARLVPQG